MARIRSVKPEICESETMARLPAEVERTYVRLWTHLDDSGRAKDDPRLVKAALFPLHDDVTVEDVDAHLWALAAEGCIVRYEVDGKPYMACPSWGDHQHPQKPRPSKIPPPEEGTDRPVPDESRTPTGSLADESGPVVGVGVVGGGVAVDGEVAVPGSISEILTRAPAQIAEAPPAVDPEQEARRALGIYAKAKAAAEATTNPAGLAESIGRSAATDGRLDVLREYVGFGMDAAAAAARLADDFGTSGAGSTQATEAEITAARERAHKAHADTLAAAEAQQAEPIGDHAAGLAAARAARCSR